MAELVARTGAYLGGATRPDTTVPGLTARQLELVAAGGLQLELERERLTVVAEDRPGLLSIVAGTLALNRLDIRGAAALDGGGAMAVEVFDVHHSAGGVVDVVGLRADLERALAGELLLSARLADLERAYARGRRPAAARPAEVRVLVEPSASDVATVIEVRAPDSRGLLYRLTRVLAESGLDVISARMSTLGHEVVDAFYVRESHTCRRPTAEDLRPVLERLATQAVPPGIE